MLRLDEGFRVSATPSLGADLKALLGPNCLPELVTPFPAQRGLQPFGVIARYVLLGAALGIPVAILWVLLAPRVIATSVDPAEFAEPYPQASQPQTSPSVHCSWSPDVCSASWLRCACAPRASTAAGVRSWVSSSGRPCALRWPGSWDGGSPAGRFAQSPTASNCP